MKIKDIYESATTAGAIAPGTPATIGKTQKRAGSLFKGKVTKKPFYETEVNEEEIVEQDLILVPDQIIKKDRSFVTHEKDRRDHEVEMARSELFAAAKDAQRVYAMLKNRTEDEGLMGWQQSYITLAADYLNSVADSLEHQAHTNEMTGGVLAGGMSNFEEGEIPKTGVKWFDFATWALKQGDKYKDATTNHTVYKAAQKAYKAYVKSQKEGVNEISDFKRKELEWELRNEPKNNYQVNIDGKSWKVFASKEQAEKAARTIERKYNKKATVYLTGASVSESSESAMDKVRDRLGSTGKLQRMVDRHEAWLDAHNQQALSRMSDEERYNAAKTQHEIDVLAHRLSRMQKDDDDWEKTFDMMRDRINRYQWSSQRDVDPEQLAAISNIKYQPTKEGMERAVDSKGRTQQDWIKAVKQKFPDAKIMQSKMIDGPVQALLPDGRKFSWNKVEQGVAEEQAPMFTPEGQIDEEKDACYNKVKSRYKVWPSAYASGALVKCRKVGASNWGNSSKK